MQLHRPAFSRIVASPLPVTIALFLGVALMTAGHSAGAAGKGRVRKPLPSPDAISKLPPDGGEEFNRLVFEKSPYLLQHARNPVDWYAWGDAAFEKAKIAGKPIFLSVGYSTCHWCHVMEHESFEDSDVAALMNEYFVPIKVDREERPDVDNVYMTVTQAMTEGSGGWPMTVIMTPDKKPFFAGTYFPKESRGQGRPGMLELVQKIGKAWQTNREEFLARADQITNYLKKVSGGTPGEGLSEETLDKAFRQLSRTYDDRRGGFGTTRKFPVPHNLTFLLRHAQRTGDKKALEMVERTLSAMRLGGIHDHVGYGYHRYSTDPDWLLPHFEKMLYDQALMAIACTEAFQFTGKTKYRRFAREIFTYVLRDMTSPEGGFYSAEDADSEGEEGLFYIWTTKQIRDVLSDEDADLFISVFNLKKEGNFKDEATGRSTQHNIPHLRQPLSVIAKDLAINEELLGNRLERIRKKLFDVREKRIHPLKDDKILTDWNGLMIAALAKAGQAFDDADYTAAARRSADFVLTTLMDSDGRLFKLHRHGVSNQRGFLEDYAFLVWGLIDLYEATFETRYLERALQLTEIMVAHFWDADRGGLYLNADDSEQLLVRSKEIYDGAIPSGNSVAALNLIRLGRITANSDYEQKADAIMKAFAKVNAHPAGHTQLLLALNFAAGPSFEIVVCGSPEGTDTGRMLASLRTRYIPNKVLILRPTGPDLPPITRIVPYTEAMQALDGAATAFVCQNFACKLPTADIDTMLDSLGKK